VVLAAAAGALLHPASNSFAHFRAEPFAFAAEFLVAFEISQNAVLCDARSEALQ